ncbi:MAG: hypothetical protein V4563_17235 [Pseudomonadota bacterium]
MPKILEKFGWPQDVLVNYNTDGQNIDPINKKIGRESYTYASSMITMPGAAGVDYSEAFLVEPACQFWMANFGCFSINAGGGPAVPIGRITLTDNATGFRVFNNVSAYAIGFGAGYSDTNNASTRSSVPRPYNFRNGNTFTLRYVVDVNVNAAPCQVQFTFEGWRDYSYD